MPKFVHLIHIIISPAFADGGGGNLYDTAAREMQIKAALSTKSDAPRRTAYKYTTFFQRIIQMRRADAR